MLESADRLAQARTQLSELVDEYPATPQYMVRYARILICLDELDEAERRSRVSSRWSRTASACAMCAHYWLGPRNHLKMGWVNRKSVGGGWFLLLTVAHFLGLVYTNGKYSRSVLARPSTFTGRSVAGFNQFISMVSFISK